MTNSNPTILTLNGGSSSIKFALFECGDLLQQTLSGSIDRIGHNNAILRVKGEAAKNNGSKTVLAPDHTAAVHTLMDWIEEHVGIETVSAIGHRVVHGGPKYFHPQVINEKILKDLRKISPFDPEHLPGELLLVEAVVKRFPLLPQVACFDTAFHHDLPRVAQLLPIPRRFEAQGIRRFGFHGLSYTFLMQELTRQAGASAANGRVILAHLGNGTSLAAVHEGNPVDTSMGFTPASGVPMSTRSGDLDPGLVAFLWRTDGIDIKAFHELVNFQSGLLGISETSADMRELLDDESRDIRAEEAISLFCYQIKKTIGAFAAALGGLDTLVFTGGIGENAPVIRERICAGLEFLGVELDPGFNSQNTTLISQETSGVAVRVIRTNEERVIGETVCRSLGLKHLTTKEIKC